MPPHCKAKLWFCACLLLVFAVTDAQACSVLYYVDKADGHIYVVNNEDYWYDVKPYIQFYPSTGDKFARLWYGWDNFAQGGINLAGLFFDAAVTPEQERIPGSTNPHGNLGDEILAKCVNVEEALDYLEERQIALHNSHLLFGDRSGQAVIVEWSDGQRQLHWLSANRLVMKNFLLSNPEAGNYPCPRYENILSRIDALEKSGAAINLHSVGNTVAQAVQLPQASAEGRIGGTLYTVFIDLTDMQFVLSYKLSNELLATYNLWSEFFKTDSWQLQLDDLT